MQTAVNEHAGSRGVEEMAQQVVPLVQKIKKEISKVIVGQDQTVDYLLISLFSRGHSLFVGVPGLAKTLLVSTLARVLDLRFNRIQFTPDLMPSDITGTDILQEDPHDRKRVFAFQKGPIFCNILLADEINRTTPKTQAALLQAMQELKVTVGGRDFPLEPPFLVFATQNPIEHEGTYALPEAQLDRFLFQIEVDYPDFAQEVKIAQVTTGSEVEDVNKIVSPGEILEIQDLVRRVPVAAHLAEHAVRLVRLTRPTEADAPDFIKKYLSFGAGPRASQNLILAAKAKALLSGKYAVSASDIRDLAYPVLQHRLLLNYQAQAEKVTPRDLIQKLLTVLPSI